MSAFGDPHVTRVTGEKFDLWETGWSPLVQQEYPCPCRCHNHLPPETLFPWRRQVCSCPLACLNAVADFNSCETTGRFACTLVAAAEHVPLAHWIVQHV